MKFANILSAFYFEPWGIRPEKHMAMGAELQRHIKGGGELPEPPRKLSAFGNPSVVGPTWEDGEPVVPQMQIGAGVAIIPVFGVLGKHLSFLNLWCGGCDYDHVAEMARMAEANPHVHTVIFHMRTPGGMSLGNVECARVIKGMTKATIAYSDEQCCSNGMLLATQCDEVIFMGSAIVGCMGTYIAAVDTSREWELMGWALKLFRSGPHKAAGMDGKTWTPEEEAWFDHLVLEADAAYKAPIKAARPQLAESAMQGQWFSGREALELGACDGLADSLEEVVNAAVGAAG